MTASTYPTLLANNSGAFGNSNLYLLRREDATLSLKADLDELAIWNKAVTPQDIESLIAY